MKIISNYKDFYDFLIGQYGIDPKVVYERVCMTKNGYDKDTKWSKTGLYKPSYITAPSEQEISPYYQPSSPVEFAPIAICGRIYCVYIYNKKFYFGDNYEALEKIKSKIQKTYRGVYNTNLGYSEYHLRPTDINEKENCPVCLLAWGWGGFYATVKNVRLSDFGIGQVISPNDAYIMISNFISREKVIVDKRTDIQKIESHGFDKKISFRKGKQ